MRIQPVFLMLIATVLIAGCNDTNESSKIDSIIVNSLTDTAAPPEGTVTIRSALATAYSGQSITFDKSLDGQTIELSIVGQEHSILKGEVMEMIEEPSGPVTSLKGYFDRDYGRSALYAKKNVLIDASDLSSGITISWAGGDVSPARVLAVYGNLTLKNVSIKGGNSTAVNISADDENQPWTLARGGGIAVWGVASLIDCTLYGNRCTGDFDSSRDRGAFGGGIYANIVHMKDCIISGNTVVGGGAAGGGVFSVGGYGVAETVSTIESSTITGNHISGLMTYGGGVFSDGGSIGNRKTISLTNCTIAENLVDYPRFLPSFLLRMGYWRGGGVYASNGNMQIKGCTIIKNEVYGVARIDDLGKPNLAGGVAATIGNAHALEDMVIGHSIIAGNTVHEFEGSTYEHDIFTGSVFNFKSMGYNRIGVIDFSQMLVPVGKTNWSSLCRKHYPKQGDEDGVVFTEMVNLTYGVVYSNSIVSVGVNAPNKVALYYEPSGNTVNQIPSVYDVSDTYAEYSVTPDGADNFLAIVLERLEEHYGLTGFAGDFTSEFEAFLQSVDSDAETDGLQPYPDDTGNPILTLAATRFFGPAETWPKQLPNYPYIEFWHRLDAALLSKSIPDMGVELLGDDAWNTLFTPGTLAENPDVTMTVRSSLRSIAREAADQRGTGRSGTLGDIGAIEIQ